MKKLSASAKPVTVQILMHENLLSVFKADMVPVNRYAYIAARCATPTT